MPHSQSHFNVRFEKKGADSRLLCAHSYAASSVTIISTIYADANSDSCN